MPKIDSKPNVSPVEEVQVEGQTHSMNEVVTMLRCLNQNENRLAVVHWLKNASLEKEPEATVVEEEPGSGEEKEDEAGEEKPKMEVPIKLLERIVNEEDGSLISMKLNFPETGSSITAPGDTVLKALNSIIAWAERMNILTDSDESLANRFP